MMLRTKDHAFFFLQRRNRPKLPNTVRGHIVRFGGGLFTFEVYSDDDKLDEERYPCIRNISGRYDKFLSVLADSSDTIELELEEGNSRYAVIGFEFVASSPIRGLSEGFYKMLIDLIESSEPDTFCRESPPPAGYMLKNSHERRVFYEYTKSQLPPAIREACEYNSTLAQNGYSSDAKEHAAEALDWFLNINWNKKLEFNLPSLEEARAFLDSRLLGMEKAKGLLMDVYADMKHRGNISKHCILFAGPPGAGKTSLVNAFAELIGLPRFTLDMSSQGKDRDILVGTGRCYHNARIGSFAAWMKQAGSPYFTCDIQELDKIYSEKGNGSIGDCLLSLLDRSGLIDCFLEHRVPSEGIMFMATANDISLISKPLLDRCIVIEVDAYSAEEKKQIFTEFSLPSAISARALPEDTQLLTDNAIDLIIKHYAGDQGAREVGKIADRVAMHYLRESMADGRNKPYDAAEVEDLLGAPAGQLEHTLELVPGQAHGVYVHKGVPNLFLVEAIADEATKEGKGKLEFLGALNDTHKAYLKAACLALESVFSGKLRDYDIAINVPLPVPENNHNFIGLPAFAALFSKLSGVKLANDRSAFIGGVSLHGMLTHFCDGKELFVALLSLKDRGITTVYAPANTAQMLGKRIGELGGLNIVEAVNIESLFSLVYADSIQT